MIDFIGFVTYMTGCEKTQLRYTGNETIFATFVHFHFTLTKQQYTFRSAFIIKVDYGSVLHIRSSWIFSNLVIYRNNTTLPYCMYASKFSLEHFQ